MNIIHVFVKSIFSWSSFILELELITITNISQYQSAFDWEIEMLDSSAPEKSIAKSLFDFCVWLKIRSFGFRISQSKAPLDSLRKSLQGELGNGLFNSRIGSIHLPSQRLGITEKRLHELMRKSDKSSNDKLNFDFSQKIFVLVALVLILHSEQDYVSIILFIALSKFFILLILRDVLFPKLPKQ